MSGAEFDALLGVMSFAAAYEAEMAKLPPNASDDRRDAAHRTFLGLDEISEEYETPENYVDFSDVIGVSP
jgi:hypothetical protein